MVNEELVADRIEALEAFIDSFPESPFIAPMKKELNYLYSLGVITPVEKENN